MGISGDWTYEKSWQEPEEIKIQFEVLIDKNDPSKGTEQKTAVFTDQQWSETWSKYQTFTHVNKDNTYDKQDFVIFRQRRTYTTSAAVCPNLYKGLLEAGAFVSNTNVYRDEITEYTYQKTEDGWAQDSETTSTYISGAEYAGSMPIVDFRPFLQGGFNSRLNEVITASTVVKYFWSTNVAKDLRNYDNTITAKRIYSKTTTQTRTALALTQEGQHYLQAYLKQETGEDNANPGNSYIVTANAWDEGQKLQADGTNVNSSLGRLTIEQKPNEYDEAEEDLQEDDPIDEGGDDTADTGTGSDSVNDQNDPVQHGASIGGSGNSNSSSNNSIDLIGTDLRKLWESWSPYGDSGTGIINGNQVWDGDPASGSDNKPLYFMKIGGKPANRGEISVNTSDPFKVREIQISPVSSDGFATNPFKAGERIFLNSNSGAYSWWYRIRSVSKNGRKAKVKYIEDILRPVYADFFYGGQNLTAGWPYRALVTGVSDSSDRVFEMPYAPDDFMICRGGDFVLVPANQQQAAARYVAVQKRLLEGQTRGVNVTTSMKEIPSAPFADVYLNMLGTSIYGRLNGTTWAFNESGCVVSTDIIYGGHAGRDGTEQGLRQRRMILERNAECSVGQTEGWIQPPDGLTNDDLPLVEAITNDPAEVKKANTLEVDGNFDPDDPPCSFWTEDLPLTEEDEVPAEELETNHVFLPQPVTSLEGRTRTRARLTVLNGTPFIEPEQITLVTRTLAENEYVDTADYPKPLITRTMTYAKVQGWKPDEGGGGGPEPPDPEQPTIDCTLRVKAGFGPTN